jgi:formate dehydrogenase
LPQADTGKVLQLIEENKTEPETLDYLDYEAYKAAGGYALVNRIEDDSADTAEPQRLAVEQVLQCLEDANLRGLGGAGFPAGRKWRILREQSAPRLLAINIDEGEPGTFCWSKAPTGSPARDATAATACAASRSAAGSINPASTWPPPASLCAS